MKNKCEKTQRQVIAQKRLNAFKSAFLATIRSRLSFQITFIMTKPKKPSSRLETLQGIMLLTYQPFYRI